jgi:hypothetical protein
MTVAPIIYKAFTLSSHSGLTPALYWRNLATLAWPSMSRTSRHLRQELPDLKDGRRLFRHPAPVYTLEHEICFLAGA